MILAVSFTGIVTVLVVGYCLGLGTCLGLYILSRKKQ